MTLRNIQDPTFFLSYHINIFFIHSSIHSFYSYTYSLKKKHLLSTVYKGDFLDMEIYVYLYVCMCR